MDRPHLETDIVIAGAGPAGLAAAIVLGRSGWKVEVLDRRDLPADKPCGEGILPPGVAVLNSLGVTDRIAPEGKHRFEGIRYLAESGIAAESEFAEGPGLGVRRTCLSAAMLETAREITGVNVTGENAVDQFRVTEKGVEVESGSSAITCRLLIGADGLHSRIRGQAGLAGPAAGRKRLGMRRHFQIKPWSRFVEVHSKSGGLECYVTPSGPEQVGIAFLWERDILRFDGGDPASRFHAMLEHFPRVRDRLKHASPDNAPMATGPLKQNTRDCTMDGVALIGDAGGYLDACTGEGITLALKQALALESCLAPLVSNPPTVIARSDLSGYRKSVTRIGRPNRIGTHLLMHVARHPRLMENFIRASSHRPEILQSFLSYNMGEGLNFPGMGNTMKFGYHFSRSLIRSDTLESAPGKCLPDFSRRSTEEEQMDDPASDKAILNRTLRQFEWINRYFLSLRRLTKKLVIPSMSQNRDRRIQVLDIGCGGGDFCIWLNRQLERKGISAEITGIDNNPQVVKYARTAVKPFENIEVKQCDAFQLDAFEQTFDYIFCSNFLHHLSDEEIERILPTILNRCSQGFLAVDLFRGVFPYLLFSVFSPLFLRNSFAASDGKISIRRGFIPDELRALIQKTKVRKNLEVKKTGLTDIYLLWNASVNQSRR